jgi:hypothetical protein
MVLQSITMPEASLLVEGTLGRDSSANGSIAAVQADVVNKPKRNSGQKNKPRTSSMARGSLVASLDGSVSLV